MQLLLLNHEALGSAHNEFPSNSNLKGTDLAKIEHSCSLLRQLGWDVADTVSEDVAISLNVIHIKGYLLRLHVANVPRGAEALAFPSISLKDVRLLAKIAHTSLNAGFRHIRKGIFTAEEPAGVILKLWVTVAEESELCVSQLEAIEHNPVNITQNAFWILAWVVSLTIPIVHEVKPNEIVQVTLELPYHPIRFILR